MPDLDFYAHVATRGDVLGARVGMTPAQWEEKLGADYLDDTSHGRMRRDYGLVELSFDENEGSWSCFGISVQVHRLNLGDTSTVPTPLRNAYGEFAGRARFDELAAVITGLGHTIEPDDDESDTHTRRYRVSESGARIFVIADADPYGHGTADPDDPTHRQVGDVWSISLSPAWWSTEN
ncbi:hypothetical protein ACFY2Z_28670 [Streptomyces sp. NPDC001222]|uniref:hypothetical protein n=1 Tax=Streptomyces sp. NPDC001222 TaxID=3364548 RepID=UPI0036C11E00